MCKLIVVSLAAFCHNIFIIIVSMTKMMTFIEQSGRESEEKCGGTCTTLCSEETEKIFCNDFHSSKLLKEAANVLRGKRSVTQQRKADSNLSNSYSYNIIVCCKW